MRLTISVTDMKHLVRPKHFGTGLKNRSTLLTPSFGNHLFEYHLVLKRHHTNNMILSSFCIPNVAKSASKIENGFINKNLTPKNDLDLVFYMCKGGNPKILNLEF